MFKKIWIIVLVVILSEGVLFAGLSVDPVTLEVIADKDNPIAGSFKVLNTGAKTVRIRVSPEKWEGKDADIGTWVTFNPLEMQLGENEGKEVSYKITPPADASGELRCIVFFVADEIGEQRSNVGIRFGVPIYAIVGGTTILDVEVSGVEIGYADKDNILSGTILVNNKSNIHIRPKINIEVFDSKDRFISSYELPYGQPAQAGQNRPFMFEQYLILNDGKYKMVVKVDYGQMYGLENRVARKRIAFMVRKGEKAK